MRKWERSHWRWPLPARCSSGSQSEGSEARRCPSSNESFCGPKQYITLGIAWGLVIVLRRFRSYHLTLRVIE
jgi:hypothetical protein